MTDPHDESSRPILEAVGLVREFGGRRAVDGVDVAGRAGEGLGLFGPNLVLGVAIFGLLDSGVFIKGSNRRQQTSTALRKRATVTS